MQRSRIRVFVFGVLFLMGGVVWMHGGQAGAAEHPMVVAEHPSTSSEHPAKGAEHPEKAASEHPAKTTEHVAKVVKKTELTLSQVANVVENHVKKKANKEGYFSFYDTKTKKNFSFKLDKIHKNRLAKVDEGQYFVCADFKTGKGDVYDLDMFVNWDEEVYDVTIHKVNGKERYTWQEKDGKWFRKS